MYEVFIEELIFLLDKIGIIAFAISGVMVGIRKNLDVFGLLVIGVITAIGGGVARDVIVNQMPYAFTHTDYLIFALIATLVVIALYGCKIKIPFKLFVVGDTIGLAVFSISGTFVAINNNLGPLQAIILAILTAVGGGVLRDLLVNDIPFILRKEVYATVAGATGILTYILVYFSLLLIPPTIIGLAFAITVRAYSIRKKLNLPVIQFT
jgi:uncharacterized membrane protein YeiH